MSRNVWKLQDAKNKFSELVEAAKTCGPQRVTRRGKPAVVVIDAEAFDAMKLERRAPKKNFVQFLLEGPKSDELYEAIMEGRDQLWPIDDDLFTL